jgi:hypothetical protein
MRRAPATAEEECVQNRGLCDMEVFADGLVFTWVQGTGLVVPVSEEKVIEYTLLADSMPWRMEYLGWSSKLNAHLYRRGEDKLVRFERLRQAWGAVE